MSYGSNRIRQRVKKSAPSHVEGSRSAGVSGYRVENLILRALSACSDGHLEADVSFDHLDIKEFAIDIRIATSERSLASIETQGVVDMVVHN